MGNHIERVAGYHPSTLERTCICELSIKEQIDQELLKEIHPILDGFFPLRELIPNDVRFYGPMCGKCEKRIGLGTRIYWLPGYYAIRYFNARTGVVSQSIPCRHQRIISNDNRWIISERSWTHIRIESNQKTNELEEKLDRFEESA